MIFTSIECSLHFLIIRIHLSSKAYVLNCFPFHVASDSTPPTDCLIYILQFIKMARGNYNLSVIPGRKKTRTKMGNLHVACKKKKITSSNDFSALLNVKDAFYRQMV